MTTTATETPLLVRASVDRFVAFLETGATDGLFAPDVFADITLPHWRVQAQGAEEVVASKTKAPPAGWSGADREGSSRGERLHDQGRGAMGRRRPALVLPRGVRLRP